MVNNKKFIIDLIKILKGTLIGKVVILLVSGGLGILGASPYFDKYLSAIFEKYFELEVSDPSVHIGVILILLGVLLAVWDKIYAPKVASSANGQEYYDHLREFEQYMEKLGNKIENLDFQGVRRLYSVLFPNAKDGDFSISSDLIDNIKYLIFQLAETEQTYEPSYIGRYIPNIDVISSLKAGLGYEITEVSFQPRAEIYLTGLYGLLGIVDKEYIEIVHGNITKGKNIHIIDSYDRLANILKLIVDFSSNNDSSFIPADHNDIFNLDLKKYKKSIQSKKSMTVHYFPFGMVHRVEIA